MQDNGGVTAMGALAGLVFFLFWMVVTVFYIASLWRVFKKAGQPGWAVLIPIYNIYILIKIAGRPGWWLILAFIPIVNVVIAILWTIGVAKNFGKSGAFALGLFLLPFVFYPILAWGDATYQPQVAH